MSLCVCCAHAYSGQDADDPGDERAQFQQSAGPLSRRRRATPGEPQSNRCRRAAAAGPAQTVRRRRRGRRLGTRLVQSIGRPPGAVPATRWTSTDTGGSQVLAAVRRQLLAESRLARRLCSNLDLAHRSRRS